MISEASFVGCRDLPEVMREQLDRPWIFVGEVPALQYRFAGICLACEGNERSGIIVRRARGDDFRTEQSHAILTFEAFVFVTGDRLEVIVFFRVCPTCGRVYWARSGPPFKRVRACVRAF